MAQPGTGGRDGKEIGSLEAGAADQRAVDVRHRHQLGRIGGLYRASIENTDPGSLLLKPGDQLVPDKAMYFLDIFRGGGAAGADCPDRLVGGYEVDRAGAIGKGTVELTAAALQQIQPEGGVDQQAIALRDAMRVLFPEAVALVSAARQGFMREG